MNKHYLYNIEFLKYSYWYEFLLEEYCRTFNIDLFKEEFFVDLTNKDFHPSREIKYALVKYFTINKENLLEYYADYFTEKSVADIASIIDTDVLAVVAYFERIKESFSEDAISGLSKYGDVTVKTKIKHISSYKIMQDFQLMERELLLTDMIKIRKKENGFNIKKHL